MNHKSPKFFASCPQFLEPLLAEELKTLGISEIFEEKGGMEFKSSDEQALNFLLSTRIGSRVYKYLWGFSIQNEKEIYANAREINWNAILDPQQTFKITTLLDREVNSFHDMVRETTFLIRALFFLLFGFVIESSELLDGQTILWSIGIVTAIFVIRSVALLSVRQPLRPLLFVAPRGLITILLFLGLPLTQRLDVINRSLIIQEIILCALVMMIGSMTVQQSGKNGTAID